MTKNEQTIANLKKLKSFHNGSYGADIDRAIKELEQEPFMNKPCVAHQICHEDKIKMLDKISAEIEAEPYISKMEVLEIIDKYKTESECEK